MSRTTLKRVLVGIWAVAFVLGAIGVVWRLFSKQADFGSYIPWGLWVALYAWLVGITAGAYMLFAVGEVFRIERLRRIGRPSLVIAFAALISGLVIVGLDLGRFERFWKVYFYGNPSSLMAWEISFYTAFGVLLLVTLVLAFRNELARFGPLSRLRGVSGIDSEWIRPLALVGEREQPADGCPVRHRRVSPVLAHGPPAAALHRRRAAVRRSGFRGLRRADVGRQRGRP